MKPTVLLAIPLFFCFAHADTIRMRDGTELEGEVISEKDDHYIVKIQVTKSIRDERKILKADLIEIVAEKKDEIAFEELKNLLPTPDLLTLKQYDDRIEAVEDFMKEFPKSKLLKDADKLLKTLDSERSSVAAGGLKFEGKIISASDRSANAYPLDARITAKAVTDYGDDGNYTQALRAWTTLETKFASSQSFKETIPYGLKLMKSYLRSVDRSLATFDERLMKRDDGLARIDERDRQRTKQAIADQTAAYQARLAKEKEERVKWPTLDPYHKEPIAETKRMLETAIKKTEGLDISKIPDGDEAWKVAWTAVTSGGSREETTQAISAVRSARLPAEYIEMLEARAPKK